MARPGAMSELQNLATFLLAPGQCDWLTGQSIMMDGGNALATGGNFYELRDWSKKLGVSQDQLKVAVRAVGDRAEAVEKHLRTSPSVRKPAKRA